MQKVDSRKIALITLFILILIVLALFVGKFTFSYLGPDIGDDVVSQGEITTAGDTLIFSKGNNLSLNASTDNFNGTSGNLTDTTNPSVKLVAKAGTSGANATYNSGILINENTYTYSTTEKTAELILTVRDETGAIVSSTSSGLDYVTVNGVSGFDITGKTGPFTIVSNKQISTTSSTTGTTHTWTYTLTFINLSNVDQSVNENAKLDIEVMLKQNKINVHNISEVCNTGENLSECVVKLYNDLGTKKTSLYHHDGTITATVANADTGVAVGDVIDSGDGSYRYAGSSATTNNYVCFGQDDETGTYTSGWCDTENLYRIIGVFTDPILDPDGNPTTETSQRVKLIKSTFATSTLLGTDGDYIDTFYYWNKANFSLAYAEKGKYHLWSYSELNKTNLNNNYLTNIAIKWNNMIDESIWYVGGMTLAQGTETNAKTVYDYEIGANKNTTAPYEPVTKNKVGLMYLSEYYYGADSTYWTYNVFNSRNMTNSEAEGTNWMYSRMGDWFISPSLRRSDSVFSTMYGGEVNDGTVDHSYSVRPTFSLKSSITFAGGSGTETDPYRIA